MSLPQLKEFEDQVTESIPDSVIQFTDMSDWQELSRKPIDCVFQDGIPVGTLGLISAEGGTGKSYLSLILGISVALNKPLIDGFTPTKQGRVLFCFGEDDLHVVSKRIAATCKAHNIPEEDINTAIADRRLMSICGRAYPMLTFTGGESHHSDVFLELQRECEQNEYRLIVVDPVIGWAGVPNENDNAAMHAAASALIDLARASGGSVLALHHANKSGISGKNSSQGLARGASSLVDSTRWNATMHRLEGTKEFEIPEEELTRYVEVYHPKNNNGLHGQRHHLKRMEGGALVSVDLKNVTGPKVAEIIVAELREQDPGITQAELEKGTRGSRKDAANAFHERLTARFGKDVTGPMREAGMKYAIGNGLVRFEKIPGSGVQRSEVRVA